MLSHHRDGSGKHLPTDGLLEEGGGKLKRPSQSVSDRAAEGGILVRHRLWGWPTGEVNPEPYSFYLSPEEFVLALPKQGKPPSLWKSTRASVLLLCLHSVYFV